VNSTEMRWPLLVGAGTDRSSPTVATYSRLHDAVEAGPMPRAETMRNDEIEGTSDGFISPKAENPVRARIPEVNDTSAVDHDDRIRCRCYECLNEPVGNNHEYLCAVKRRPASHEGLPEADARIEISSMNHSPLVFNFYK